MANGEIRMAKRCLYKIVAWAYGKSDTQICTRLFFPTPISETLTMSRKIAPWIAAGFVIVASMLCFGRLLASAKMNGVRAAQVMRQSIIAIEKKHDEDVRQLRWDLLSMREELRPEERRRNELYNKMLPACFHVSADYGKHMVQDDPFSEPELGQVIIEGCGVSLKSSVDAKPQLVSVAHIIAQSNPVILPNRVYVHFPGRPAIEVVVASFARGRDLVVFNFKNKADEFYGTPALLGDAEKLGPGLSVMTIGSPNSFRFLPAWGELMRRGSSPLIEGLFPSLSSQRCNHGSSGSPVFAFDESIIGIANTVYSQLDVFSAFISAKTIHRTLIQFDETHGELEEGSFGAAFANVIDLNPAHADRFGIVLPLKPEGVIVTGVFAKEASDGKLQKSDLITHRNDVGITSAQELIVDALYAKPKTIMTLRGLRNGVEFKAEITLGKFNTRARH